jgi:hypothetical protein
VGQQKEPSGSGPACGVVLLCGCACDWRRPFGLGRHEQGESRLGVGRVAGEREGGGPQRSLYQAQQADRREGARCSRPAGAERVAHRQAQAAKRGWRVAQGGARLFMPPCGSRLAGCQHAGAGASPVAPLLSVAAGCGHRPNAGAGARALPQSRPLRQPAVAGQGRRARDARPRGRGPPAAGRGPPPQPSAAALGAAALGAAAFGLHS